MSRQKIDESVFLYFYNKKQYQLVTLKNVMKKAMRYFHTGLLV